MPDPVNVKSDPILSGFLRLFWLLIGNLILVLFALFIAFSYGNTILLLSIVYWATVVCMIGARYFDIRFFNGQTADYTPATMSHFGRYSFLILIITAVGWGVALLLSRFKIL